MLAWQLNKQYKGKPQSYTLVSCLPSLLLLTSVSRPHFYTIQSIVQVTKSRNNNIKKTHMYMDVMKKTF